MKATQNGGYYAPLAPHSLDRLSRRGYAMLAALCTKNSIAHYFFAFFTIDSWREHGEPFHREHSWLLVARSIEFENHAAVPWELGSPVFQWQGYGR